MYVEKDEKETYLWSEMADSGSSLFQVEVGGMRVLREQAVQYQQVYFVVIL